MPAASDDAATALAIMREWDWLRCDPDGNPLLPGKDLGSIINRLAIEGIRRPETKILQLLCQGDMVAKGVFRWQKFQDYNQYYHDGSYEIIKPNHWLRLAKAIESARIDDAGSYRETTLQFSKLEVIDCLTYEWTPVTSSFSYADVTDDLPPWDDDYTEEWYSAWDIEAWPRFVHELEAPELSDDSFVSEAGESKQRRGRPPANWWPDFAEELALTIHEEGIPAGTGHVGQSGLLDKVCERLAQSGKPEPSRTTAQPVINAVLARIRSAGK